MKSIIIKNLKWTVPITYISFSPNGCLTRDFYSYRFTFTKEKVKNSPVLTMSTKCEKLSLRFCWKAVLPRNKLKLCFPKINCQCELPLNNSTTCQPHILKFLQSSN